MSPNRLDLNLLHVFDTICREGNLTRAAQALHLTQPAISHSLARLRSHFNDPLFIRQGSQMVPTPLARRLLQSMRPGLEQIRNAVNQFHTFDPAQQGKTFTLALRDILESTFLPELIARLAPYPDIEVRSQRVPRREMETLLAAGKLDFAIDVLLPVSNQTGHELLRQDRLVVLARRDHPALRQGLDMETYLNARHVLVSSRAEGPGIEDFALARHGTQRHIRLRCQHYYAACRVVEKSDLLLTMPETYARIIAGNAAIQVMTPPLEMPPLEVHLYWHKAYEQEPSLVWLREQLRQIR